jgi:uncharacterized protein YndB with AHSA1/START domain
MSTNTNATTARATLQLTTPSDREVVMTRPFDAPRHLVWDALTKPELIKRWMDAPDRTMQLCEVDLWVGGQYRFVWRGAGKPDVGMHGEYRDIVPGERFVRTEKWEDWDAGELVVTAVLLEQDGKTLLTNTVVFPSREIRDTVLKSGMQRGSEESFAKLAALLAAMAA